MKGCAVDVSRGDGTVQEDILEKTKCFRDVEKMLNSTTVALNFSNTHRYKP